LREPQRFYACMLFVTVLLSLGPDGLYRLLYDYAPGFDGVRAVPRIHILHVFGLAVFVAYGVKAAADRLAQRHLAWVTAALPLVLLIEGFSAPLPMFDVRWGNDVPGVYSWLQEQEGDFAVIEYPLTLRLEFDRLLYSSVHRKKLVNGISGYLSPVYREMQIREGTFPSAAAVADNRALGVRWIIVHRDRYSEDRWPRVERRLQQLAGELELVTRIDDALVFEIADAERLTREDLHSERADVASGWTSLPTSGWTLSSDSFPQLLEMAIDGDGDTRWHTDPQTPGQDLTIDFGEEVTIGGISMGLGDFPHDYPRGYRLEVSRDGENWHMVAEDARVHRPITDFLDPLDRRVTITIPATSTRYVRIVQTGRDRAYVWTISELEVLRPGSE
jgi:hypothetical protein